MLIAPKQRKAAFLACVLVLSGCSRDGEALGRFSRACTAFLDKEYNIRITSIAPVLDAEKQGTYWTELRGAVDVHAPNKTRWEHARSALNADSTSISNMMEFFNSDLDRLDRSVLQLVEIANSIRNREYREDAIAVSRQEREVQSAFASLRTLSPLALQRTNQLLLIHQVTIESP